MKKIMVLSTLLGVFLLLNAGAEQIWQGNAAVIRQGGFETTGLFAASNSFPKNSKIEVTNLENGKVVTVTVVKRINDDSNVFLLLSSDAASMLGMGYNDVIRVKTKIMAGYGTDIAGLPGDLPFNPDEDVNPSAGAPDEYETDGESEAEIAVIPENIPENGENKPETDTTVPKTNGGKETVVVPEEVKPVAEKDAIAGRQPRKEVFTTPYEDTSIIVHDRATAEKKDSKLSAKDVALKDAEVGKEEKPTTHALTKPKPENEEVTAVLAEAELPLKEEPATAHDINKPSPEKEVVTANLPSANPPEYEEGRVEEMTKINPQKEDVTATLPSANPPEYEEGRVEEIAKSTPEKETVVAGELKTPEVGKDGKPSVEEIAEAKPVKEELIFSDIKMPPVPDQERPQVEDVDKTKAPAETELALVPTEPRPPKEKTIEIGPEITPGERIEVTTSTVLSKNQYYLQIGAYTKKEIAEGVAKSYTSYPVNIVATHDERQTMYKVLIGPLKKDEGGAVLYWFKAKGYRDAFLKYIKE